MRRTRALLMLALTSLLGGSACGAVVRGPKPPVFSTQQQRAALATARVERVGERLSDEAQQLEQTRQDFFELSREVYRPPFPMGLFKQTAMACLNQPLGAEADEVNVFAAPAGELRRLKIRFGVKLTCTPASLHDLLRHIERRTPDNAPIIVAQLERVDRVRVLRGKLLDHLARMPRLLRAERAELATMRAEWRQQRDQLRKKRKEFNDKNHAIAMQRLEAYRRELERLDTELERVERTARTLDPLVQASVEQFTFDLVALYGP